VHGRLYGDPSQLAAQGVGAMACILFVFSDFYAFFKRTEVG